MIRYVKYKMWLGSNAYDSFNKANFNMLFLYNSLSGPFNFTQGQAHTSMLRDLPFNFVSAQYLLNPLNDLWLTSPKCPSQ